MPIPLNPPGPKGLPLLGSALDFRGDKLGFMTRVAREYGPIAQFRVGSRRIVLLSEPAMIEQMLAGESRHFIKHRAFQLLRPLLGDGLVTAGGALWLRQRRLMQPAFHRAQVETYAPIIVAQTERRLAEWTAGDVRDLHGEMTRLTLAVAAQALLDVDLSDQFGEVSRAIDVLMEDFCLSRRKSGCRFPRWAPTPRNRRVKREIARLDRLIYDIIDRRRHGPLDGTDLLSRLMRAQEPSGEGDGASAPARINSGATEGMSDRQLRDEAITLLLAGHETTANALAWTWYLLARHPAVEQRLTAELAQVLGSRSPTAADAPRLPYTEQVVLEAMRLYPPVFGIGRRSSQPCVIGPYDVPAGTTFFMSQWVVHRDGRFFERPEEFRPERWDDGLARRLPKFAYFPFGGGPRMCIGSSLAMLEAVLIVATIAGRFRFELAPGHPVELWPTVTLRPKNGIWATCHAANAKPADAALTESGRK